MCGSVSISNGLPLGLPGHPHIPALVLSEDDTEGRKEGDKRAEIGITSQIRIFQTSSSQEPAF